jgi:hypothetical protein
MPNWCSNNLNLSHDNPDMISRAKKAFEENKFFKEFVPLPEKEDDWYSWCCENWGTKWDVANGFVGLEAPKELELGFDTAWSPPIAFYKKMEDLGFTVFASYREDGMGYIGEYANGEDECYDYDFADDEWRNHLPDHLAMALESEYEFWKEYQEEEKAFEESQN